METHLADWLKGTPDGIEAESILRSCVHCGFCTATCPTYQLLGDERDGPRGRIYLIKRVLEGAPPSATTQRHLDRCLTCRGCESTCPSGVRYGHLVDIGRKLVAREVERPRAQRVLRAALREGLTRRWVFGPALRAGQALRPLLPAALASKVPPRRAAGATPRAVHERRVLVLDGCVQPAMYPSIDAATARVLDALRVQAVVAPRSGCCGAIRHHLDDPGGAIAEVRRNIDAWWPFVAPDAPAPVEAIVINASGCGAMVKDYGHLLRDDPDYAARAVRVSSLALDLGEFVAADAGAVARLRTLLGRGREPAGPAGMPRADAPPADTPRADTPPADAPPADAPRARVAFHAPCTLQHGQQVRGVVERLLGELGAELATTAESHLCCGSAGTYSITQPSLSRRLRERKLGHLEADGPALILSANVGCIAHLQAGTATPVRHWIEWLDDEIAASATGPSSYTASAQ